MNKTLWDASLYDNAHGYISEYGIALLSMLSPQPGEKILDAGCATGDLCHKINELGAEVLGIDNSAEMVSRARKKYPQLFFEVVDITSLPFVDEFDGIHSNAVLHWVKDTESAITSFYRALKPGGRFVAEMGGKDNIQTLLGGMYHGLDYFGYSENKRRNPWVFFSVGEYAALLEKAGFIVREMSYFDRPTELDHGERGLRNWITMFGNVFFQDIPPSRCDEILLLIEKELRDVLFRDGKWIADYRRLRVRAEKPKQSLGMDQSGN